MLPRCGRGTRLFSSLDADGDRSDIPRPITPDRGSHSSTVAAAVLSVDEAIRQCVETDMESIGAPGAAVTVILDGQVIFNSGYHLIEVLFCSNRMIVQNSDP